MISLICGSNEQKQTDKNRNRLMDAMNSMIAVRGEGLLDWVKKGKE